MKDILATSIFILSAVVFFGNSVVAQQPNLPTIEQIKAQKFIVVGVDGKRVDLRKLLGQGNPVVLDIWATWCGPCRQEIPHLVELNNRYRPEGLIVLGLTVEEPDESRQAVKAFAKQYSMNYQIAFAPKALYLFFNPDAATMRIPQTMIFGSDGVMIKRLIGYNPRIGKEILNKAVAQAVGRIADISDRRHAGLDRK